MCVLKLGTTSDAVSLTSKTSYTLVLLSRWHEEIVSFRWHFLLLHRYSERSFIPKVIGCAHLSHL